MDKVIITIARGYGSGGRTLGKRLASSLGIGYYDREILGMVSNVTGINQQLFENADEQLKSSSLFKIAKNVYREEVTKSKENGVLTNDSLFTYQAKVISQLAKHESFVIIGRCADYILRERKDVLRLFVYAPLDTCADRLSELSTLNRDDLKRLIIKTDIHRAQYYSYYTGRQWNDAKNYDLCLNTAELSTDKCLKLVKSYLEIV